MMTAGPFGGPMAKNDGPMGQRMTGNDVGMGRPPPSRDQSNKIDEFLPFFKKNQDKKHILEIWRVSSARSTLLELK